MDINIPIKQEAVTFESAAMQSSTHSITILGDLPKFRGNIMPTEKCAPSVNVVFQNHDMKIHFVAKRYQRCK